MGFPSGSAVKNLPAMQEPQVWSLGGEDSPGEEMATHSSILTWNIPRTKESGGLQSMGSQSQTWLKRLSSNTNKFIDRHTASVYENLSLFDVEKYSWFPGAELQIKGFLDTTLHIYLNFVVSEETGAWISFTV